jgi:hypothetical protein
VLGVSFIPGLKLLVSKEDKAPRFAARKQGVSYPVYKVYLKADQRTTKSLSYSKLIRFYQERIQGLYQILQKQIKNKHLKALLGKPSNSPWLMVGATSKGIEQIKMLPQVGKVEKTAAFIFSDLSLQAGLRRFEASQAFEDRRWKVQK